MFSGVVDSVLDESRGGATSRIVFEMRPTSDGSSTHTRGGRGQMSRSKWGRPRPEPGEGRGVGVEDQRL